MVIYGKPVIYFLHYVSSWLYFFCIIGSCIWKCKVSYGYSFKNKIETVCFKIDEGIAEKFGYLIEDSRHCQN